MMTARGEKTLIEQAGLTSLGSAVNGAKISHI
jgi:hypothetical protein